MTCATIRNLLDSQTADVPWPESVRVAFIEHLEACPKCKFEFGAVVVLERWLADDHADPDLGTLPGDDELSQAILHRDEVDSPVRTEARGVRARRTWVLWGTVGAAAALVALAIGLWPSGPLSGQLYDPVWSAGGVTRGAPDPELFGPSGEAEFSFRVQGSGPRGWLLAVVLTEKGNLGLVRFRPDRPPAYVEGTFNEAVQPFIVKQGDLPTHVILLLTREEITRQRWATPAPPAAQPGQSPEDVARVLRERFGGRSTILNVAGKQ